VALTEHLEMEVRSFWQITKSFLEVNRIPVAKDISAAAERPDVVFNHRIKGIHFVQHFPYLIYLDILYIKVFSCQHFRPPIPTSRKIDLTQL